MDGLTASTSGPYAHPAQMFEYIDTAGFSGCDQFGIKHSILQDLLPLVILAGPNGGGKTRFLQLLEQLKGAAQTFRNAPSSLERLLAQLPTLEQRASENPGRPEMQEQVAHIRSTVENLKFQIAHPIRFKEDGNKNTPIIHLPPIRVTFSGGVDNITLAQINTWEQPLDINLHRSLERIVPHLVGVAQSLHNAKHPDYINNEAVQLSARRAQEFCRMVKDLMGVSLSYQLVGQVPTPTLGGRKFVPSEISVGQAALLSWATLIETRLWVEQRDSSQRPSSIVLSIDEPENHLHPHAAVAILRRLLQYIEGRGQVWLATHSPTILAAFAREASVYHVDNGKLDYASANPTRVVEGLVGGEEERHMLRDMLDDADRVTFFKFAAECLQNALVIEQTDSGDPQFLQFVNTLRAKRHEGGRLRVLDFAAGKARFAMALAELLRPEERASLDYFAYDCVSFDVHKLEKRRNVSRLYPDSTDAHMSNSLSDFMYSQRVDMVVLCNALHEIPISEWYSLMGDIATVLSDTGTLLILEDLEMPVGELPNSTGFIVPNLEELRILFRDSKSVISSGREDSPNRCSAVAISRAVLDAAVGSEKRKGFTDGLRDMLHRIKRRALADIKALRQQDKKSHRSGRAHARSTMLLANAELALEQFGG